MKLQSFIRSKSDRMISGVCGGIAQTYRFDAVVVRGVFVVLGLVNPGIAAIVYVAAIFLIPEELPSVESGTQRPGWRYDPWTGESLGHTTAEAVVVDTAPKSNVTDVLGENTDPVRNADDGASTPTIRASPSARPTDDEV